MVNISNARVHTPTSTKRRKRRPTTRNRDTNNRRDRRSTEGDSREDASQRIDPNSCAADMVNQEALVEVLSEVTKGTSRKYWIFITNICAITRFCLEKAPNIRSNVKDYVKHMELGDALLAFILDGPHPSLLPQNGLPPPWNKANSEGPPADPNMVKQQSEASGSGTPVAKQESAVMACLDGAEGQSTHLDDPSQAIQRSALADSAPMHQQPNQQPPQEHSLNERLSPTQGTAGPNFTSFKPQPPPGLATASAPALPPAPGGPNPLPTTQFPFPGQPGQLGQPGQPGQVSHYASNTVSQGSSNPVQLLPTSSTVQQFSQGGHPVMNPGSQPLMAQPFQNTQQSHATPLNVAPKQSQAPAAHPMPTQVHAGQPTGTGWIGQSQVPPTTMQSHQGPALPSSNAQPTFFPGFQWAANPPGLPQIGQATVPVQQGNITLPTQVVSQPQGQHMFNQPPVTQSQTGNAPNPHWPSSSENMPDDFLDFPFP